MTWPSPFLALAAAIVAAAAPAAATADDTPSREVQLIVVGAADAPADLAEQLRDVIASPPIQNVGRIDIARAEAIEPAELFDLARPDAGRPTAWIDVGGGVVHVRAAAAGRTRFVFRDITVARPLTELDRERIGQALRAALTTVIEGASGGLGRDEAQRAAGFAEQRRPVVTPPANADEPRPPPPQSSASTGNQDQRPLRFHLGGALEVARIAEHFVFAPGLIAELEWAQRPTRPSVWVSLVDILPNDLPGYSSSGAYSLSFRVGVGATPPPLPWLHGEAGVGYDYLGPGWGSGHTSLLRLASRVGPTDLFGIHTSLTLLVEYMTGDHLVLGVSNWRPGLAIALWWL